jgi:predicted transcriptional regulator
MHPLSPSLTDRTDLIERILAEGLSEAGITERKIKYQFSESGIDVDLYLSSLMRNDLLQHDNKTNTYRTTQKGSDFLENVRKIYELDHANEN